MLLNNTLFILVVCAAYFIEGIIGFGATIIAIPFITSIFSVKVAVPAITAIVFFAASKISLENRQYINFKVYKKMIIPMFLGLPFGILMFSYLPEKTLKILLGLFMILISVKELYVLNKKTIDDNSLEVTENNGFKDKIILFLGGVMHGAFASGGPFVIIYASSKLKNKHTFRATLALCWVTLNAFMTLKNIAFGAINTNIILLISITVPFVFITTIFSNKIHSKIDSKSFSKFIYIILIISGLLMFR
ncbi:MAG: sulfite exporter TauE/SafE family protein [Terrisporobacter sp.]|uniref:sulfite exporter TauE/SafE family protein n=1 Tax=Terrisporobacter sp. TaxID=1965305 RepID=UPI002FC926A9